MVIPAGGGAYVGAVPGYGGGGSFIFGGALASCDLSIFYLNDNLISQLFILLYFADRKIRLYW